MSAGSLSDHSALVDEFHSVTRTANDTVDEAARQAQDHAYALGLARGKADLIDFSKRLNAAKAADNQREWSALIDAICKVSP